MDYRERKYYLLRLHCKYYNEELQILKKCVPSLKYHPPYNHYYKKKKKIYGRHSTEYDGCYTGRYVHQMISCQLSEVDELMKFINHYGYPELRYCTEVTKEDLGQ